MAIAAVAPTKPLQDEVVRRLPRRETIDARLYLLINGLPHTRYWDAQIELLSDLGKGIGWVTGSAWLAIRDGSRGRRAGLAATTAMFAAIGLVQGPLKRHLPRDRPFKRRLAFVVGIEPVDSSFPSGHTAGSFAAATALAAFYPDDRPLLLSFAAAVGLSRVYLGHHFVSDVLVGAALGSGLGALAARLLGSGRRETLDDGAAAERPARHRHRARAQRRPAQAVPRRRRLLVKAEQPQP
jgi:undecaprenyl-diphosphatase